MEKVGIFCLGCPIRTRSKSDLNQRPVALTQPQPVSTFVARHMLGADINAVGYETVGPLGTLTPGGPSIVTPADMPIDQVLEAFAECQAPAPSTIKFWKLRIGVGQHCMALAAIEEAVHWDNAEQRAQEAQ